MPITGVNHITVCCEDLDRAMSFYINVLGADSHAVGARSAYLSLGPLWLCLEHAQNVTVRADDSHIAFDCPAADFDALAQKIKANAQTWKSNRSEGASLYFLDPDGHKLELHVGTLQDRLTHYATREDAPMQVVKSS